MNISGNYLMYKCYPDYTALRLGLPLDRGVDPELAMDKTKGKAITVGLWMFDTDSREPMKDVLMRSDSSSISELYWILKTLHRLHEYIKRDEPYPEQFRYGPDRPPPPNPYLRISNDSSPEQTPEGTPASVHFSSLPNTAAVTRASITRSSKQDNPSRPTSTATSMSEIEKLFSRLAPEPSQSPAQIPAENGQQGITINGLFAAALSDQNPTTSISSPYNRRQPQPGSNPSTTNRSLALLDSIFASATPHYPNGSNDTSPVQTSAPSLQIISPQPTPSAAPQVLNQNVISTLLGLAPSPGGSVSSSSTNITTYRYEGDNESNSEGCSEEIEYPTSNVNSILSEATRNAISSCSKGKQSSIPSFSFSGIPTGSDDAQTTPRIEGDVTPRPVLKGMPSSSPLQQPKDRNPKAGATRKPQDSATPAEISQFMGDKARPIPGTPRKLVPFEPDSELWPYPRQPLDDRASDDDDVVELDFNDTGALIGINAFPPKSNANANATNGVGATGKRKKKEKNKEEREQIEKSWDDPVKMGYAIGPNIPNEQPPAKPVQPQSAAVPSVKGKNKPAAQSQTNGKANGQPAASSSKDKGKDGFDRDAITESLISTVAKSSLPKQKDVKQMDRNTFVREILTLFHVRNLAFAARIY